MEWKDVLGVIVDKAPAAGIALAPVTGGTSVLAGLVIKMIANAFGIKSPDPKPEEVMTAIQSDPQAVLKLETARLAYEQEKMRLEYEEKDKARDDEIEALKVQLADVQSARQREVEITKVTGKRDINQYVLAWTLIAGFFALLAVLMFRALPADSTGVVFMLFGALSAGFGQVTQYFFGSSKGSAEKTVLLANSTPASNKK